MEQGGGFNMTSFRGAPLRHCEAELFRSRWIRFFGRTAFGAAIQIYRYIYKRFGSCDRCSCARFSSYTRLSLPERACLSALELRFLT